MRMPTAADPRPSPRAETAFEGLCRRTVLGLLGHLAVGRLEVVLPDGTERRLGPGGAAARLAVLDPRFFSRVALHGDVGLGEAYQAGWFRSDDLTALIRLLLANEEALAPRYERLARLGRAANRLAHLGRANTRRGSRGNIRAHYDLSNDMFALFLDESMTYSCGYYERPEATLAEAQAAKRRLIIEKTRLAPGMRVLEVGSGWGTLAVEMARDHRVSVTSLTLSEEQLKTARELAAAAGVSDRVSFELLDYRDARGSYDRIVSVEMVEAVGHEHLPGFFGALDRLLARDGLLVLQAITMPDHRYDAYRRGSDWIQKHIFPGACVPSLTALVSAATEGSRLMVEHSENIGVHYARTLREWRSAFLGAAPRLRALGFGDDFVRTWDYYFSYCEAGFADRVLGDVQLVLTRMGNKALPGVP